MPRRPQRLTPRMRDLESATGCDLEDRLRRLYVDEGMTLVEIGRSLGRDPSTIYRWLVRLGIPTREYRWVQPEKSTAEVA